MVQESRLNVRDLNSAFRKIWADRGLRRHCNGLQTETSTPHAYIHTQSAGLYYGKFPNTIGAGSNKPSRLYRKLSSNCNPAVA
jgi:hypothetical protein